jgi:hypothetical protein
VILIQSAPVEAFHEHPAVVITPTVPLPPSFAKVFPLESSE